MNISGFIAAFTINVAPVGQPGGFAPTPIQPAQTHADDVAAQAAARDNARDNLLKALVPTLQSIQDERKFAHVGSVSGFDLLGPRFIASSDPNQCLLLLELGSPGLDTENVVKELRKGLPEGSRVQALGEFSGLASGEATLGI
jgi:hypothetical protein